MTQPEKKKNIDFAWRMNRSPKDTLPSVTSRAKNGHTMSYLWPHANGARCLWTQLPATELRQLQRHLEFQTLRAACSHSKKTRGAAGTGQPSPSNTKLVHHVYGLTHGDHHHMVLQQIDHVQVCQLHVRRQLCHFGGLCSSYVHCCPAMTRLLMWIGTGSEQDS